MIVQVLATPNVTVFDSPTAFAADGGHPVTGLGQAPRDNFGRRGHINAGCPLQMNNGQG